MKHLLNLRLPSRSMLVAVVALVVAIAGSAYASSQINGALIKKNSMPGNRVKRTTFVPKARSATSAVNAQHLGNLAASAFERRARWALINASGTIVSQSGGISVSSHSNGDTYLNFGSSVAGQGLVAVPSEKFTDVGRVGVQVAVCGGGSAGELCPAGVNDTNHVYVLTTDETMSSGSQPEGFYIAVIP